MKYWAIWYRPVTRSYSFPHSETCGGMELQMAASLHPPSNDDLPNTSTQTVIWASERKGPRMCFSAVSDEPGRQIGKWKITPYGHRARSGSSISFLWRSRQPATSGEKKPSRVAISCRQTRRLNRSASHTNAGGELTPRNESKSFRNDGGNGWLWWHTVKQQKNTPSKGNAVETERKYDAWHVHS